MSKTAIFMKTGALLFASLAALAGCTGKEVRQTVGLKRNQPDEFQVVSRPPLSVPPVYHLRPPAEESETLMPADKQAEALVLEGKEISRYQRPDDQSYLADTAVAPVESSALGTQGETTLLQNAKAAQADPEIRSVLRHENGVQNQGAPGKRSMMDKLKRGIFVPEDSDPVVDAQKERERIQSNRDEDKPLNEGDVPVIDPKDKGILDSIL